MLILLFLALSSASLTKHQYVWQSGFFLSYKTRSLNICYFIKVLNGEYTLSKKTDKCVKSLFWFNLRMFRFYSICIVFQISRGTFRLSISTKFGINLVCIFKNILKYETDQLKTNQQPFLQNQQILIKTNNYRCKTNSRANHALNYM